MKLGLRRKSRELALQILFQNEYLEELELEDSLALYLDSFDSEPETWEYAKKILGGIRVHKSEIDSIIQDYSPNWKLDRMSKVDKNILRVASFEIRFSDQEIPVNVIINEAIEIGKKFGSTESASFLNGILDKIAKGQ